MTGQLTVALLLAMQGAPSPELAGDPVPPLAATTGVLPKGSELELMVLREVDSNRAQPGDEVRFLLTRPLALADGTVLADKGARATGAVVEAKKSGIALQRGAIRVKLKSLAVGNVGLPISGEIYQKGKGGKADDVLKVALVSVYALFSPGNAGKLKAGETVHAVTQDNLCVVSATPVSAVECPADSADSADAPPADLPQAG